MIRILTVLLCSIAALTSARGELIVAPGAELTAPTNHLSPAPDGDRFLFIVDTSSSTKRLSLAAREAVVGMIYKGLDGRMTNGDTFGVWTVASTVRAGQFPMQVWDDTRPLALASLAGHFVRAQPIDGKANFSALLSMLHSVINSIKDVNVFLITDGSTEFKGTQLDQALNGLVEKKRKEARRLDQPLVVTLAARGGRVAAYSVTTAGERIDLPPRPPRAAPMTKSKPDSKDDQPSQSRRSIIITKSTSEPSSPPPAPGAPASTNPPAAGGAVSPTAAVSAQATNHVAGNPPATASVVSPERSGPTTNPTPASAEFQLAARKVPPAPTTPPTATPEKPEAPVQEDPEKNPPTAEKIPPLEPPERPVSIWAQTPPEPRVDPAAPVSPATTNVPPPGLANLLQQPLLVSARERGSNPVPPLPAPQATAAPANAWTVQTLLIVGSALLLVAMILLLFVVRHHRRTSQPSFITRSMDRR